MVSFYKLDALLFSVDSPDRIKGSLSSTTCKNVLTRATYMSVTIMFGRVHTLKPNLV